MKIGSRLSLIIFSLIIFDVFVWTNIFLEESNGNPELYFLDVGQGDSELVVLPPGIRILIDGGPDNRVLNQLDSIINSFDRYLDLVVLSHPQLDHFGGLVSVLNRYKIGAFIFSGQEGTVDAFNDLKMALQKNKIPTVALIEGDKIKYVDSRFDVLSPSKDLLSSAEPNDWCLVLKMTADKIKALFTGDIDNKIEDSLIQKYGENLDVDVLKVSHHGSKYSSSESFLTETSPKIAVIEVGKNSYGHPTDLILNRLSAIGARIFRTDENHTIKLALGDGEINIFSRN